MIFSCEELPVQVCVRVYVRVSALYLYHCFACVSDRVLEGDEERWDMSGIETDPSTTDDCNQ